MQATVAVGSLARNVLSVKKKFSPGYWVNRAAPVHRSLESRIATNVYDSLHRELYRGHAVQCTVYILQYTMCTVQNVSTFFDRYILATSPKVPSKKDDALEKLLLKKDQQTWSKDGVLANASC